MSAILCGCCCRNAAVPSPSLRSIARPPPVRSLSVATAAESQVEQEATNPLPRRRLILLRHAESKLGGQYLRDHDRSLSEAGRSHAVHVSLQLQQMGWAPQLILSSDATRTKETLRIMQEQAREFSEAEVHFIPSFYSIAAMDGQTAEHLQKAVCEYSRDEILTVMCMGHNRGWEEAASMFSGASVELKTCNAALLESSGRSWDEFGRGPSRDPARTRMLGAPGCPFYYVMAFALAGLGGWKLHGIVKPT